jgi:hypothetical protein
MKKNLLSIITFSAIVLVLTACKKDEPGPQPIPIQPGNYEVYDFFEDHGVPVQTFSVKADEQTTITTTAGAKIYFSPNIFQTITGTIVTGYVDVTVREIYNKKDMLLSNAPTTSGGELLGSKGELFIHVSQNGEELFPRWQYGLQIPTTDTQGYMPLFNGVLNSPTGNPSDPMVLDWVQDTSMFYAAPITPNVYYYSGYPSQFNWINCDYFYSDPNPKDTLTAILPDTYNESNTVVFLSLDTKNTIGSMYNDWAGGNTFKFNRIPIGTQVHVISISESDGKMYFDVKAVTISANSTINLIPQEIAEDQIEVQLNNLP